MVSFRHGGSLFVLARRRDGAMGPIGYELGSSKTAKNEQQYTGTRVESWNVDEK